ncbi:MAG TPA: type IV pilus assembly protein PilM [Candidatus Paceibacterota bacterium]|nr:type IV pilus assembly protein PilM [Candidatus Paceibacterota bacterium]HPT18240.1 type IV pilus assembly protein PilM [Candidatus Paceibacterota bacterium]
MNNPFKDFFSNIKVLDKDSNSSAVGIDIGSSSIKVVEIKKKGGKATLVTYGMIALGPYADIEVGRVTNLPVEKTIEALKETLKQSGVTTTSSALAIPSQSSLVFTIELPPQVKKTEMASIVSTEARKYIPVPIDEVSLDWFILPKKEISFEEANNPDLQLETFEKTEVLVVAIQNDVVSKYRSIVDGNKLNASFFEIEIFSSIRSNFEHELSLVLLMDFGASRTKLSIVEFGTVKSFHIIQKGGADITDSISKSLSIPFAEAEKMKKEFGLYGNPNEKQLADIIKIHTDYIFSETNNVLLGYEKKYNKSISKVIITGGGSLLKGLKEVASANFKADIEIGRPFSKVGAPAFLDKALEATGPEFGVAIGLALRKLQ